ncbi:hypothetical protein [Vibrio owensii]|uniref:hypothetical protein n=1 Tax=Vibrio harveyi group TaxID=717610 RepID=UPI003CC5D46E
MNIGNCKDIADYHALSHIDSKIFMAFLTGHIITIDGQDYRFARKGQELYENGEYAFSATETGIFQRMLSFSSTGVEFTKENADSFIWQQIWGDSNCIILSLTAKMTDQEKSIAVANLAFDIIQNNRSDAA